MPTPLPTLEHVYQNHHLDSTRWRAFRPRAEDVVIATSYKSGTTWMQGIVLNLVFQGQVVPPRGEVSLWIDRRLVPLEQVMAQIESQNHRRVLKSHLALDGLPYYPQVRYIVVGRDARDVFMSLWNHYSNYTQEFYALLNDTPGRVGPPLPACPSDLHQFWQGWITQGWFEWESEGYPFWGNLSHIRAWWPYRNLENILFVHYNDLLRDLRGEIRRIARFLDIPVTDDSIESVASAVTLENMRSEEEKIDAGLPNAFQHGAKTFFFKGTNGRWKDVLSADELELYHAAAARVLTPDCARWLEQGGAVQS